MADPRKYASALDDFDIESLANMYNLDENFVRGMKDADWCNFLGCQSSELPYYLLKEIDESSDEDDTLFDDFDDVVFDIQEYLNEQARKPIPANTLPVKSSPLAHNYSKPSAFAKAKPTAQKVVPHHFELVK